MANAIELPGLGPLVRDKWGGLVTLRRFPFLPEFARSAREIDESDVLLVRDWEGNIAVLAPEARAFGLRDGLHREGVFEVYVECDRDERPSDGQIAAFGAFASDERQVCRNLVDAMLRYYRSLNTTFPENFDPGFPANPDVNALAGVLEFDCLNIQKTSVRGVVPLVFSWSPAWDEEHGLQSLVYAGQVLCVGTDEVSDMEGWPSDDSFTPVWNRSVMTPAEVAAYESYRAAHPRTRGGA